MKCQRDYCNGDLLPDRESKQQTCSLCARPYTLAGNLIYPLVVQRQKRVKNAKRIKSMIYDQAECSVRY